MFVHVRCLAQSPILQIGIGKQFVYFYRSPVFCSKITKKNTEINQFQGPKWKLGQLLTNIDRSTVYFCAEALASIDLEIYKNYKIRPHHN